MTGQNMEIISQIVQWYENSFHVDCHSDTNHFVTFQKLVYVVLIITVKRIL